QRTEQMDENSADFYKFLAANETIVYDSTKISSTVAAKIQTIKRERAIDVNAIKHYDETLRGKKLGIVGLGRIGGRVAQIGEAFGMSIQYAGPHQKDVAYDYVAIDDLMKLSDIVSVNVKAHIAEGLVSTERIDALREGTYFINTSDANAVNQESLTRRMVANEVYAALDVYQGLPTTQTLCLDENSRGKVGQLLGNHVLTYRAGWKTQESIRVKTYKLLGHMMDALNQE
ncbi:MAG: NAD(P)-dependent oxidoreductase, partial [Nanoarchaeota archaeon]|nr:NAD(P)-dependent oxidoreductase [Nanoarchaeota archaeon]